MKKYFLLIILFFAPFIILKGQKKIFLDTARNQIEFKEFNNILATDRLGWGIFKKDSSFFHLPSECHRIGQMNEEQLSLLKLNLDSLNIKVNKNQTLLLYYITDLYMSKFGKPFLITKTGHFSDYELKRSFKYHKVAKEKLIAYNLFHLKSFKNTNYEGFKFSRVDSKGILNELMILEYPLPSSLYLKEDGRYLLICGTDVNRPDHSPIIREFVEKLKI